MIDAVWKIEFLVDDTRTPAGVLAFVDEHIYGGGEQYVYYGDYLLGHGRVAMRLDVFAYNAVDGNDLPFGGRDEFELELAGQVEDSRIVLAGAIKHEPESTFIAVAEKVFELPTVQHELARRHDSRPPHEKTREWLENILTLSRQSERTNEASADSSYTPRLRELFEKAADLDRKECSRIRTEISELGPRKD